MIEARVSIFQIAFPFWNHLDHSPVPSPKQIENLRRGLRESLCKYGWRPSVPPIVETLTNREAELEMKYRMLLRDLNPRITYQHAVDIKPIYFGTCSRMIGSMYQGLLLGRENFTVEETMVDILVIDTLTDEHRWEYRQTIWD